MKGMGGSRIKYWAAGMAVLAAGGAAFLCRQTAKEKEPTEITIYLDHSNQVYVRAMVAMYENMSEIARYSRESGKYPEVTWNLVDKSGLTAQDYRAELLAELEEGNGPDLVFLDEYSCESPEALMEAGYFADLGEWMDGENCVYHSHSFLPGTLEAGQRDGAQYLIPVSVDIPVLCTTRSRLERLGLSEEELGTTEAILRAAERYEEVSGSRAFADGDFWEKLEEDWEKESKRETEEPEQKEEGLYEQEMGGERDWGEGEAFSTGKAFAGGAYLFLTAGMDDYRVLSAQLTLLPEEEEILFLPLTGKKGSRQAVLRQMVAVNRNTPDKKAAFGAMNAFYVGHMHNYADGLPVDQRFNWAELMQYESFLHPLFMETGENGVGSGTGWSYGRATGKGVETACLPVFDLPEEDREKSADGSVLTVMVPDSGWDSEGAVSSWLSSAAKEYERTTGTAVELCANKNADVTRMFLSGTAADITMISTDIWPYSDSETFRGCMIDYESYLEQDSWGEVLWKEGFPEKGLRNVIPMIPAALREGREVCIGFAVTAGTKLPGEALEFIRFCLEDGKYQQMLDSRGWQPVLEN